MTRRSARCSKRTGIRGASGAAALALALGAMAGCSSGGSSDSGGSLSAARAEQDSGPLRDAPDALGLGATRQPGTDQATGGAPRVAVQTRQVIFTGKVSVATKDLDAARQDLDRLLGRVGGYVAEEKTVTDDEGRSETSSLALRIPAARFDQVMDSFASLGTVTDTNRKAEDVTTEVIDIDARIRTQEVSLRRLRTFLGRSTNVDTIIRLESEIARREADLASMRSQQNYLDDQTSLATISLQMTRTTSAAATPKKDGLEDAGFVTGLRNGWNALLDVLVVIATVLGAMLPFVTVAAVVGLPLILWLRSARRRTPETDTAPSPVP